MKKGAMELSIGTVVVIVLAMSMLILGMVLVKNIFSGANEITDMTNEQLKNKVAGMFGEDKKLVVYPDTRHIELKTKNMGGFGIGIKNLIAGGSAPTSFSYVVSVSDRGGCSFDPMTLIMTGKTDTMTILPGEFATGKVLLEIPEGTSLCTFRYRVEVKAGANAYASELMDVTIKA